MTYLVSMENTRTGKPKRVTMEAANRFEAEALAEMQPSVPDFVRASTEKLYASNSGGFFHENSPNGTKPNRPCI